jgi:DNA-binding response OmpR family regulator
VSDPKILKILLVEDDLQDEQLLSEAFLEIEEHRLWCNWRTAMIVPAEELGEAADYLRRSSFDVILLNLSLPDSPSLLDTFLDIHASASNTPVIVLADEPDENLANRLLREGAQDVLVKPELECAPLARAIRYAVERQRRAQAVRTGAFTDELTGVLSREAFLSVAVHYRHLSLPLVVASLEVGADHRESREPLLMQAAEILAGVFEPPSVIGRWDRSRLCLITAGLSDTTVGDRLRRVAEIAGSAEFSVTPLEPGHNLEELLSIEFRSLAKTAILAD